MGILASRLDCVWQRDVGRWGSLLQDPTFPVPSQGRVGY